MIILVLSTLAWNSLLVRIQNTNIELLKSGFESASHFVPLPAESFGKGTMSLGCPSEQILLP